MRVILLIICIQILSFSCGSQKSVNNVRLVKWSSGSCDNTYDPYRLKTRISSIEYTDSTTIFNIHFSDNCCVEFKPSINFHKNKLELLPYRDYKGDLCTCTCCFSIRYEVSGLVDKKYQVFFRNSEVILTDNYYDTVKTSFQAYNGKQINRLNKYGLKEGTWIKFYENGKEEVIDQYPETSLFYDLRPIWSKGYYPSGRISFYDRGDTTEFWFEDGEFKSQSIKYKVGDTTFEKGFQKFENRQLQKEYFERSYPTVFTSEFDPDYKGSGSIGEPIFLREFFQSGKPKFVFGDTSFSYYETGQIESKNYKNGSIQYDHKGILTGQTFSWFEKGPKDWRNLDNTLYVQFFPNGNIKEIELVRDEATQDGISPGTRYSWTWNTEMSIIEFPKNWKEPFPWTRFTDLRLNSKMLIGLDTNSTQKKNYR